MVLNPEEINEMFQKRKYYSSGLIIAIRSFMPNLDFQGALVEYLNENELKNLRLKRSMLADYFVAINEYLNQFKSLLLWREVSDDQP